MLKLCSFLCKIPNQDLFLTLNNEEVVIYERTNSNCT
jgi:hypothetical protein